MSDPSAAPSNHVVLVGRLAAAPEERTLPSQDLLVTFRLVVAREAGAARPGVDTIDCAAWTARVRRQLQRWDAGDTVEVTGALRRRFWRGPAGAATSRYEVEVGRARRVGRATMAG